jgi:hypothetical protein
MSLNDTRPLLHGSVVGRLSLVDVSLATAILSIIRVDKPNLGSSAPAADERVLDSAVQVKDGGSAPQIMFLNIFYAHLIDCLLGCGSAVATDCDLPSGTPTPRLPSRRPHPGKRRDP